jgi:hypothetical protein
VLFADAVVFPVDLPRWNATEVVEMAIQTREPAPQNAHTQHHHRCQSGGPRRLNTIGVSLRR